MNAQCREGYPPACKEENRDPGEGKLSDVSPTKVAGPAVAISRANRSAFESAVLASGAMPRGGVLKRLWRSNLSRIHAIA